MDTICNVKVERTKCGEIYHNETGKLSFLCLVCTSTMEQVSEFEQHSIVHFETVYVCRTETTPIKSENTDIENNSTSVKIKSEFPAIEDISPISQPNDEFNIKFEPIKCGEIFNNGRCGLLKYTCFLCTKTLESSSLEQHIFLHFESTVLCVPEVKIKLEEPPIENQIEIIKVEENHSNEDHEQEEAKSAWQSKVQNTVECDICGTHFNDLIIFKEHILSHKNVTSKYLIFMDYMQCDICQKIVRTRTNFTKHMRNHIPNSYKCRTCGDKFNGITKRNLHEQSHSTESLVCNICSSSFGTVRYLKQHKKRMHSDFQVRHKCTLCSNDFRSPTVLERHLKAHAENKTIACKVCDKTLGNSSSMIHHMKLHSGLRTYLCKYCGKAYAQISSKIAHEKKKHKIEKDLEKKIPTQPKKPETFVCTVCSSSFDKRKYLQQHIRRMHSDSCGRYKCSQCTRDFNSSTSLENHLKAHAGKKTQACKLCNKTFATLSSLQSHMQLHSGTRPYLCKYCGKDFAQIRGKINHEKKWHEMNNQV